jgi:signal transduction histidine kinase
MNIAILSDTESNRRVFEIGPDTGVTIGRSPECDICLQDERSSRRHARIVWQNGRPLIEDLNSRNGTLLNDRPVMCAPLAEGDRIAIGALVLQVSGVPPVTVKTLSPAQAKTSSVLLTLPHAEADLLQGKSLTAETDAVYENRVLREIVRISQLAAAHADRNAIVKAILQDLHKLLEADTACLLTRSMGEEEWTLDPSSLYQADGDTLPISQTVMSLALGDGQAVLSENTNADWRLSRSQSILRQGTTSVICAPVKIGERFESVLFLDRRNRDAPFTALDLRMTASVANILGIFLAKEEFQDTLRRNERLAAVGEALASLAHYIKNVLAAFQFAMSTLTRAVEQQRWDVVGRQVGTLADQEKRMSDLVLNMLSFVKERKPEFADVSVDSLVETVVQPFRPKFAENGIVFEFNRAPDCATVWADEMGLYRVFLNLLLNSLDALDSAASPAEKKIGVAVAPCSAGTEFRFYDTGCGVPRDKASKLFTPFFSTKGSAGTGLGLAVVQKLIEEHGGTIRLNPDVQRGAEFVFIIPPKSDAPHHVS